MTGGNPTKPIRKRFDEELTTMLLELQWWDFEPERLLNFLPVLCNSNLAEVRESIRRMLNT